MKEGESIYIGDGVYASFDGFHLNLHVGSHDSPRVVALEPKVLKNLIACATSVNIEYNTPHFVGTIRAKDQD